MFPVLVNGCSHTYGSNIHGPGQDDPHASWPNYIGSPVRNLSAPTRSNSAIVRTTMTGYDRNTESVVMFSNILRKEIIVDGKPVSLTLGMKPSKLRKLGVSEREYEDYVINLDLNSCMNVFKSDLILIHDFLTTRNVRCLFLLAFPFPREVRKEEEVIFKQCNLHYEVNFVDYCKSSGYFPIHNYHYGVEAHKSWGKYVNALRNRM